MAPLDKDFEKLGVFYLGREVDRASGKATETPVLYDSRDLTTHAVCVGMTGSGKTGLCLALLEEAAIDGIPALVIDPKGDLANLMLAFPELTAPEFRPWVDPAEAARKGLSPDDFAAQTAKTWREGLAEWGQDGARVARFRDAVDIAIYTPGSNAGLPLSVLKSFAPGPAGEEPDAAAQRERIGSVVGGLLALLQIDADPLKSREYILLSSILDDAWRKGQGLELASLIAAVQKPPFEKVGVFDLESFYPAKERMQLALAINTLLASPGFSVWTQGEPLDVQRLLFTPQGKPRISILSIAHLDDAQRMFTVTLVLNEVVAWMRRQSGTSSLRAIVYMDEIFGYFPPNAMPPAKLPMLTLLKQARAFGVGVMLATQNPVDLDYKGLGNTGTWFIGRLQTERDKLRVIEGLQSALGSAEGTPDRTTLEELLSSIASRVFLMRNVHDDAPVLMKSRWALSYLRGPLTLVEIGKLMEKRKSDAHAASGPGTQASIASAGAATATTPSARPAAATTPSRPVLAGDIVQYFLRPTPGTGRIEYRPQIAGLAKLHFVDAKAGVDTWRQIAYVAPLADDGLAVEWSEARTIDDLRSRVDSEPAADSAFADAPAPALRAASYAGWGKALAAHLYETARLDLAVCDELKSASQPGESEGDFRARIAQALRERRDEAVAKLREKFAAKLRTAEDQLRRAQERVAREQAQYSQQKMQSAISIGATVLGAIFGGRRRTGAGDIGRAAGALRTTGRLGREKGDVDRAEDSVEVLQQRLGELQAQCEAQIAELQRASDAQTVAVRTIQVPARKSDIAVGTVALLWTPWREGADGFPTPASET